MTLTKAPLFIISVVVALASCHTNSDQPDIDNKQTFPYVKDTFQFKTTTMVKHEIKMANYAPYFMGEFNDTVMVNYKLTFGNVPPPPPPPGLDETPDTTIRDKKAWSIVEKLSLLDDRYLNADHDDYPYPDSGGIKILINTSQTIKNIDLSEFQNNSFTYTSYPVMLINNQIDTVIIGYGGYLPLILQAKDNTGQWKDVESHFIFGCGTGLLYLFLPPQEVVLTSVIKFSGNYKTKLRLRYGFDSYSYSEVFNGYINYDQFNEVNRFW